MAVVSWHNTIPLYAKMKIIVQAHASTMLAVALPLGEIVLSLSVSQADKIEMVDKGRNVIVLCFGDKVERSCERDKSSEDVVKVGVVVPNHFHKDS